MSTFANYKLKRKNGKRESRIGNGIKGKERRRKKFFGTASDEQEGPPGKFAIMRSN